MKNTFALLIVLSFILSGCLKTRTQVRGDDDSMDENQTTSATAKNGGAKASHYEIEELKNEIIKLSGKVEELEHSQKGMNTSETNQMVGKLDMRVADLEKNQILIMSEIKELKDRHDETPEKPVSSKSKSGSGKALLSEGFSLLMAKQYEEAGEKFKEFGERNPKGKDAAEMRFGLGEVSYGQKAWKKAIVEYSKVQESSTKSPRIPASLLKIGLCFEQLGMQKEAKSFFSELLERFPQAAESKKAQSKMKK